jgi:accessory gene regulator B
MKFIHKWSFFCARYLAGQMNENHEKRRVYYFGFQLVIGSIVKGVLLVALAALFGSLLPTLLSVLIFGSFRLLGGGYHMDTYGKCIAVSLGLFIVFGIVTQYTYSYWKEPELVCFIAITLITAIFVTIKWVPKDTPNKPITNLAEIKKFKKLSSFYILVWLICMLTIFYLKMSKYELYIIAVCVGFLLELFSISPLGHSFFDKVSGKVDVITLKKSV